MDSRDNFRERIEALDQQRKAMGAHTDTVDRRRWGRGIAWGMALGLLGMALWALPVAATLCDVPSSAYPTIQAAVDDATCVIINVAAGTYTEHVAIDHNVIILGAGQDSTIIDGSGSFGPVFGIGRGGDMLGEPHVMINDVTIKNGTSIVGGGITSTGTLTLQNSTVTDNHAFIAAGGIINYGTLTLQNSNQWC